MALLGATGAGAQGLTQDEALHLAFPAAATVERRTAFLSDAQLDSARTLAGNGIDVGQRIITYYVGRQADSLVGVAYFDSHRVRTLNEVVMIVVEPQDGGKDRIRSVEVLRFAEPPEYHASDPWLDQFKGKSLDQELSLKRSIANMTGATLTSNAIVRATRRVLAIHERIRPFGSAAERPR